MYWIVAYDVRSNRRRNRTARRCERAGLRLQQSVFLIAASQKRLKRLIGELAALIDPATDHLAAWPLRESWRQDWQEAGLPAGPVEQNIVIW